MVPPLSQYHQIKLTLKTLGGCGQYCRRVVDIFNTRIRDQCYHCGYNQRLIDNEHGNYHSFTTMTATRLTTSIGFRGRGPSQKTEDRRVDHMAVSARYGFEIDEVPEELFNVEEDRKYKIILQSLF